MSIRSFITIIFTGLVLTLAGVFSGADAQVLRRPVVIKPGVSRSTKPAVSQTRAAEIKRILSARRSGTLAPADPCSTTVPILLNQPINATLDVGDCQQTDGTYTDFYDFSGTAGQAIFITYGSPAFDTYLYLYDDSGTEMIENDDSGGSTNSRIPRDGGVITLPYTGHYTIIANSYAPTVGAYTIEVNSDPTCAPAAIAFNTTVNGTLVSGDCTINEGDDSVGDLPYYTDLYTFNGTAGQAITITMTSTAVNSYIVLHTPSGTGSLSDTNGVGGTAQIPASGTFSLPETGTYTLEASTFNTLEQGAYSLIITGPNQAPLRHTAFDFDGDGKTDVGIFRPNGANGAEWWYSKSSDGTNYATQFGAATDKIVAADFTGDGKTDIAFFRPSTGQWFVLRSEDSSFYSFPFGASGDIPVPADFDGDGKADAAVFRPSTAAWYISNSGGGTTITQFGLTTDLPVPGDYDGDGKADVAVYRPTGANGAEWWISKSTGGTFATQFGAPTDKAVPGDYTGDGKTDIAFWRPSTGQWYILRSEDLSFYAFPFGAAGDSPVPGDYDGDGKTDAGVFRASNSTWYINRSTAGVLIQAFGTTGDLPLPNAYVR